MDEQQILADIEVLARMAVRLAGGHPDEHVKLQWGEDHVFEGPAWCHPDILSRAKQAYLMLA